ncbi:MAG: hypothetical protein Q9222_003175 [Ikaeria aurantiellina]
MAVEVMRMPTLSPSIPSAVEYIPSTHVLRKKIAGHKSKRILPAEEDIEAAAPKASSRSVRSENPTIAIDVASISPPKDEPEEKATSRTRNAGDIDGLITHLGRTKLETAAPTTSRNIAVPRGYELGMAFNLSEFYDLRSDFRRLDKRKRDLGVIPPAIERQKHGFRPEELLWYGAIDLKDCKPSNLANDIHPLLDRDCFDDTPDHIYDQLVPGLRLATLFLSHPACMQFWVTLARGERRVDHEMSRRCGKTRHRISRNVEMTKENVKEVTKYMKDLGHAKVIHFAFTSGLLFEGNAAFGTAHTVCDFLSENSEGRENRSLQRAIVRLHSDFYIIAKKLSTMRYPDPAQKLRFNFILATLIVHEMAHAIELSQWRNRAPSPYEPFLLHHNEAELGRVWESYMFGGQVAPINDRVDGIYGIATWNWPRTFGEMDPERTICYALPMKYIERIQQKATWERKYDFKNWRAFHIPRDGATSIYMNSVTTVSWTEEERVAKEALQEQRIQDSEEPAKKKRETAGGQAVAIKDVGLIEQPGIADEKEKVEPEKGTVAQQVGRVKVEPQSVLSRKKRRVKKKSERKALDKKEVDASPAEKGVEGDGSKIMPHDNGDEATTNETIPHQEPPSTTDDIDVPNGKGEKPTTAEESKGEDIGDDTNGISHVEEKEMIG